MPIDLASFFDPRSIAVIGASADGATVSGRPLRILKQHGFGGSLYPVNPRYDELFGLRCYPRIGEVPDTVDLAIVAVPASIVPSILRECAAAGVRHAMVFSSGFAESGQRGRTLQDEIASLLATTSMRVCGPNCEGFFDVQAGVPAGFSPALDPDRGWRGARAGPVAIVAQSGGLGFALFNRGLEQGLGFSKIVTTGNEVDLRWLDFVEFLVDDPHTGVILGFVESLRGGRRLVDVARKAAERGKPIVVAKVGRSTAGQRAAASHTGSLVGSDDAFQAAFRQLGVIRVQDVDEMLDAAAFFSAGRLPTGPRVAVVTASGGAGVWLADALADQGFDLPELEADLQERVREFVPTYGSAANPVDVTAQTVVEGGLERAIGVVSGSRRFDSIAVITSLAGDHYFKRHLPALRQVAGTTHKALVYYSYTSPTADAAELLRELRIPLYQSPARAAAALGRGWHYRQFLDRRGDVRVLAEPARGRGDVARLDVGARPTEWEARAWFVANGMPAPPAGLAGSAAEAAAVFREIGGPVAVKVLSPDLPHKSDVGGVILDVASEEEVERAYRAVTAAARRARPGAEIRGVLVQGMVRGGVEVLVGARVDPDFGPLILFGLGGVQVEILRDVALRLAPISLAEARAMIDEVRGSALLRGARGRPPADLDALAATLVRFSEAAQLLPEQVAAAEINPLMVLPVGCGVLMVDAAVEIAQGGKS